MFPTSVYYVGTDSFSIRLQCDYDKIDTRQTQDTGPAHWKQ